MSEQPGDEGSRRSGGTSRGRRALFSAPGSPTDPAPAADPPKKGRRALFSQPGAGADSPTADTGDDTGTRATRRGGWTEADIGDQSGRLVVITGANSGIGLATARTLAAHHAHVVLACRNPERAEAARRDIQEETPGARVSVIVLDLADLSTLRPAVDTLLERHGRVDVLVNNAGLVSSSRRTTADGFELQFGTNHLGPFALTALLFGALGEQHPSRVVTISSIAHRLGWASMDDLDGNGLYYGWDVYSRTKLANLLFAFELQRRLAGAGSRCVSLAAHPGLSETNFGDASPWPLSWLSMFTSPLLSLVTQSAEAGALPVVRAATDPGVRGGEFFGPSGPGEVRGAPVAVAPSRRARDQRLAAALWQKSEAMTGVTFEI